MQQALMGNYGLCIVVLWKAMYPRLIVTPCIATDIHEISQPFSWSFVAHIKRRYRVHFVCKYPQVKVRRPDRSLVNIFPGNGSVLLWYKLLPEPILGHHELSV